MSVEIDGIAARRVELGGGGEDGLARLVLTLVKLIHELLERQAIRRMERGSLSEDELERLGCALMAQSDEIVRLCGVFGIDVDELSLDLGGVQYIEG